MKSRLDLCGSHAIVMRGNVELFCRVEVQGEAVSSAIFQSRPAFGLVHSGLVARMAACAW